MTPRAQAVLALVLGACADKSGADDTAPGCPDPIVFYADADGDGFGDPTSADSACSAPAGAMEEGGDCDDTDAAVHPGASERCDGVDQDCDGAVDEDATDAVAAWTDQDGDGWGGEPTTACPGADGTAPRGDDCDDLDPTSYPGAPETWYDGVDQDCAGDGDGDADGDGVLAEEVGGDDCDDTDPQTFPGAPEVCEDGIDQNCDGRPYGCGEGGALTLNGDYDRLEGGGEDWYTGLKTAGGVDLNGDGRCDVVVASPGAPHDDSPTAGRVDVWSDPVNAAWTTSLSDSRVDSAAGEQAVGTNLRVSPDSSGDLLADLAVVSTSAGGHGSSATSTVWVLRGPFSGAVSLSDSDLLLTGAAQDDNFGLRGLTALEDQNGDEADDWLVGATGYDTDDGNAVGAVFLFYGNSTGRRASVEADASIYGTNMGASLGQPISSLGDSDGDGIADVAINAYQWRDDARTTYGRIYAFSGPLEDTRSDVDASATITGEGTFAALGWKMTGAGDLNGDGLGDLWANWYCEAHTAYCVSLFLGPITTGTTADAAVDIVGPFGSDWGRGELVAPGDLDGDGFDDLVVSSPSDVVLDDYRGTTDLLYGPFEGTRDFDDDATRYVGGQSHGLAGYAAAAGDLDADGFPDLVVGAPGGDTEDDHTGGAWLILGGEL
jgi:hypothetical protein